jgi:hypothetical protein
MGIRLIFVSLAVALVLTLASFGGAGSTAQASSVVLIDASPDSATNLVGEDHTITAVVTDGGQPSPDWEVTFNVIPPVGETSAPNEGDNGTDVTDANGEASFTYTGDGGAGTDAIEVCVTQFVGPNGVSSAGAITPINCEIVEKVWVDPTPTPTPEPSATPTATPAEAAPAAELPDTGSQPPPGDGFPWLGALALTLAGTAVLAGGWAVSKRSG